MDGAGKRSQQADRCSQCAVTSRQHVQRYAPDGAERRHERTGKQCSGTRALGDLSVSDLGAISGATLTAATPGEEETMALSRRQFLCRSFGAFGAAALAFERFGLLNAFAQSADYRALVCLFLFGGNDS